jgi:hypothetical protein
VHRRCAWSRHRRAPRPSRPGQRPPSPRSPAAGGAGRPSVPSRSALSLSFSPVGPRLVGAAGGTRAIIHSVPDGPHASVQRRGLPAVRHLRLRWHRRLTRRRIAVRTRGDRRLRRVGDGGGRIAHRAGEFGHPALAGLLLVLCGLFWGIVNPGTLVWILDAAPETFLTGGRMPRACRASTSSGSTSSG